MCGGRWPRATKCVIDNRSEETLKCRHRPIIVVDDCTFRFQTKWRKKNNWERIKKKTTFACIRNCCLTQITNGDPLSKKPRVFGFDSKSTRWTSKKLGNNSVTRRTGGLTLSKQRARHWAMRIGEPRSCGAASADNNVHQQTTNVTSSEDDIFQ